MREDYVEMPCHGVLHEGRPGSFWHVLSSETPSRIARIRIDLPDEGSMIESIEVGGVNQTLGPIPAALFTEVSAWRVPDFYLVLPVCEPKTLCAITLSGKAWRVRLFFEPMRQRLC